MAFQYQQSKMMIALIASFMALSSTVAFNVSPQQMMRQHGLMQQRISTSLLNAINHEEEEGEDISAASASTRRLFLSTSTATAAATILPSITNADDEGFESIAAKAAKISKTIEAEEAAEAAAADEAKRQRLADSRTAYDFELPVQGQNVPFAEMIRQEFGEVGEDGKRDAKVKAVVVLNIKQDDPIARKDIAELIALASKFGRSGEFAVVCCPTDQGYYEPDTSALIRLKMASEYGYGINPATVVTDKVILLGTGAHPFWRWIQGTCRTPAGLGKIQANFEKFLVDGRTGLPLRRYPRKYQPYDMTDDIDALMKGKPLPPPSSNWKEEWRQAVKDAESDTYRFQKGLNYFDQ